MEFVSQQDKEKIEARLAELIGRRKILSVRIQTAREMGDLKENAEYHAAREEQGMDEAEIKRLEERLEEALVVEEGSTPSDIVFLGSVVKIKDVATGEEDCMRLVGESSGDLMAEPVEVTVQSPMGEALLKARLGETVRVDTPRGVKRFEVLEIE